MTLTPTPDQLPGFTPDDLQRLSDAIAWMWNNDAKGTPAYEGLVELRDRLEGK